MTGYKLLLVPDDRIEQTKADEIAGQAWVVRAPYVCIGPFNVIAGVGDDGQIRMSRLLYDQIEIVEPPSA